MLKNLDEITSSIIADPQNKEFTERGIFPLFSAPKTARINIVGQVPGLKAEQTRLYWNDKSGDRLRDWLGVDYDYFYNSGMFAVLPMISIILEKVNRVTYHLVKVSQKNGIQ